MLLHLAKKDIKIILLIDSGCKEKKRYIRRSLLEKEELLFDAVYCYLRGNTQLNIDQIKWDWKGGEFTLFLA